jgi:hypothetical protein
MHWFIEEQVEDQKHKILDSGLQLPLSVVFNPLSLNPCPPIGTLDAASGQVVERSA